MSIYHGLVARDMMYKEVTEELFAEMEPILRGVLKFMKRSNDAIEWIDVFLTERGVIIKGEWDKSQPEAANEATKYLMCGVPNHILEANSLDLTYDFLEETRRQVEQYAEAMTEESKEIETIDDLKESIQAIADSLDIEWDDAEVDDDKFIMPEDLSKKRTIH